MHFQNVLIAGAGPSGLLLALMLAQHNINVDIVEQLDGLDDRPRGAGYGSAAVQYECFWFSSSPSLNMDTFTLQLAD